MDRLIEHRDPGALAGDGGNPPAGVIHGLGSDCAGGKPTTNQGPILGQAEVIRAIVIESRAAQAVGPPREPHRAVLVLEYPGETVLRLHAHQDVNRDHGESLTDHTMLDELEKQHSRKLAAPVLLSTDDRTFSAAATVPGAGSVRISPTKVL